MPGLHAPPSNHGYFPRDGRNITKHMLDSVLMNVLGCNHDISQLLIHPFPYASDSESHTGVRTETKVLDDTITMNLDNLNKHNRIEHDASLSRQDAFFGDNHSVNVSLVQQLLGASSDGVSISTRDLVEYRIKRYNDSKARNPEFVFGAKQEGLAWEESALLLTVLGDGNKALSSHVESLFLHERFPTGFKRPAATVGIVNVGIKTAELIACAAVKSVVG
ncbi:Chloroperoxidase [Obelidium mucronatum]|nr:Chloroperoxidase [Obelidium mucronatum]